MLWWLFHITAIFWGLQFPFHAEKFKNTGKNNYLHLTAILIGLILPGIVVAVHFITGGFDFGRIPAIYCNAMSRESNIYATIIPVAIMLTAGVTMLILIFTVIYKVRAKCVVLSLQYNDKCVVLSLQYNDKCVVLSLQYNDKYFSDKRNKMIPFLFLNSLAKKHRWRSVKKSAEET